jgi:hypothetical protein
VEIAGEPERGTQSSGAASDYGYIIAPRRHAPRGCKKNSGSRNPFEPKDAKIRNEIA